MPEMGNDSKMLTCATYALYHESLQRVQYPVYHMGECTIEQYNLEEMDRILPEADERRSSKRKEEDDSKQKWL